MNVMKQLYDEEAARQIEFLNSLGEDTNLLIDTQWNRPQQSQSRARNACTVVLSVPFQKALCVYPVSVDFTIPSAQGHAQGNMDGDIHEEVEIQNPHDHFEEGTMFQNEAFNFPDDICCNRTTMHSPTCYQ